MRSPSAWAISGPERQPTRNATSAECVTAEHRRTSACPELPRPFQNSRLAPSPDEVEDALVGRDVGFYHAIMMQCFLPQKALPNGRHEWQVSQLDIALDDLGLLLRKSDGSAIDAADDDRVRPDKVIS